MAYTLTVVETFAAAHHLPGHKGACESVHGHTWRVEADWRFAGLDESGMATDFADLKQRLRDVLPDHRDLNEVFDFTPTAENLSRHFCEALGAHTVRVWESEGACASYTAG
jgi:6-pyruvoyltetrahydropterin/6-carboxytetrahydropterin synthase